MPIIMVIRIVLTISKFILIRRMEPLNSYAKPIHLGSGVNGYIWTSIVILNGRVGT